MDEDEERTTYVTGSTMAEVQHQNLDEIITSEIYERLGSEKGEYFLLSAHPEIKRKKSRNAR